MSGERKATSLAIAVLPLLLLATSCRNSGLVETTFASLGHGSVNEAASIGQGPHLVLFRSRAAWERASELYMLDLTPEAEQALAAVDFATQSVAAFTLGGRPSGGYDITLQSIAAVPPPRFELTSKSPGPGEMVIQITTHPFHLVVLNGTGVPSNAEFVLDGKNTAFRPLTLQ